MKLSDIKVEVVHEVIVAEDEQIYEKDKIY